MSADVRDMQPALSNQVTTNVDLEWDKAYVNDSGVVVAMPENELPYYDFDYSSKQWVFDLQKARDTWWESVKRKRRQVEFGTLEHAGNVFDIDEVSQRRIQGAVQLAGMDPAFSIDWTAADNSVVTMDATAMVGLGAALGFYVNLVHQEARRLRGLIESAASEAELQQLEWIDP